MENIKSPLLTRDEAAGYLRLSVSKLDTAARNGEIRRVKIGDGPRARVLYRINDLDEYVAKHLVDCDHARRSNS